MIGWPDHDTDVKSMEAKKETGLGNLMQVCDFLEDMKQTLAESGVSSEDNINTLHCRDIYIKGNAELRELVQSKDWATLALLVKKSVGEEDNQSFKESLKKWNHIFSDVTAHRASISKIFGLAHMLDGSCLKYEDCLKTGLEDFDRLYVIKNLIDITMLYYLNKELGIKME